jgi:hypothetical protein
MAQVPEALARLEERRRKWQEAQHVYWRWGVADPPDDPSLSQRLAERRAKHQIPG